ncbi:hypothetical protein MKW98_005723 [Papaver atlanticum]|uniref:Uncharacterized protein n=1 Tax=Papaver atlanticum TaxID=357466 RepID=A0AAD4RZU4_9MAGN|nr:hypothetical protein MKW98_005723 [Papaver atlanticum]
MVQKDVTKSIDQRVFIKLVRTAMHRSFEASTLEQTSWLRQHWELLPKPLVFLPNKLAIIDDCNGYSTTKNFKELLMVGRTSPA